MQRNRPAYNAPPPGHHHSFMPQPAEVPVPAHLKSRPPSAFEWDNFYQQYRPIGAKCRKKGDYS